MPSFPVQRCLHVPGYYALFQKNIENISKKDRVRGLCLFKLSPLTAPAFSCKIQTKQMFIYLPHGEKTPTDKVGRGCLRECLGCRHS